MKESRIREIALFSFAFGVLAAMAAPSVGDVEFWQNPTTKVVKVTYVLSGKAGVPLLDIRTNGVSIGWANLRGAYGDVYKLGIGYLTADEICECMIDYDVVDPETRKFIPEKQPQQVGS